MVHTERYVEIHIPFAPGYRQRTPGNLRVFQRGGQVGPVVQRGLYEPIGIERPFRHVQRARRHVERIAVEGRRLQIQREKSVVQVGTRLKQFVVHHAGFESALDIVHAGNLAQRVFDAVPFGKFADVLVSVLLHAEQFGLLDRIEVGKRRFGPQVTEIVFQQRPAQFLFAAGQVDPRGALAGREGLAQLGRHALPHLHPPVGVVAVLDAELRIVEYARGFHLGIGDADIQLLGGIGKIFPPNPTDVLVVPQRTFRPVERLRLGRDARQQCYP